MSKIEKRAWGYEYTSDNNIVYEIGEISGEYNAIIDSFSDIWEMFDTNVLIKDKLVDYVYGNLIRGDDFEVEQIKNWLDWRIPHYENHERIVVFYRDIVGKEDTTYECYIGFAEEKYERPVRISRERLAEMAEEDKI